jgi:predicted kinase
MNNMNDKVVIILVSVPGGGKSTITSLFKNPYIVSMDLLRMKKGKYVYRSADTPKLAKKCFELFSDAVKKGRKLIIVDNTNVRPEFCEEGIEVAEEHGYKVMKVFLPCTIMESATRNTHKVPLETIKAMHKEMEHHFDYEMYWKEKL